MVATRVGFPLNGVCVYKFIEEEEEEEELEMYITLPLLLNS